jgi:predicted HTH transcriptional regulator
MDNVNEENMTEKDLRKLVDELRVLPSETEWVEFKENRCEKNELGEYMSALANSACLHDKDKAYLVFGIKDQSHLVVGTSVKLKHLKIGNEELENWLSRLLEPHVDFRFIEFPYNGHLLSIIIIDPARNQPVRFKGTAYIRVGSYKRKLADFPEKERKIWGKTDYLAFETEWAMKNADDDKVLKLLDYPAYFRLTNQNLPSNKQAILDKLEQEKLIPKPENHLYHITNLGAALFAVNLNEFDTLSRKAMRVIFYKGKNRLETIKEQIGVFGYAVGFEGLIEFINDRLPVNEEIVKALRREVKMYPSIAIRELVANALIHQDFGIKGAGPMVEIFSDRIEVSNPGSPLIDTLRFIDHHPQSRNEKLAALMRRMNICEERGSGIDKVIYNIEMFQLPAPAFIADENFMKVILYGPRTLRQMDKVDKIRACYQHCALKFVSGEHMTNQSLRDRFKIEEKNYPTASRIIADTMAEGLIKDYGPGKKAKKYAAYIPFWA